MPVPSLLSHQTTLHRCRRPLTQHIHTEEGDQQVVRRRRRAPYAHKLPAGDAVPWNSNLKLFRRYIHTCKQAYTTTEYSTQPPSNAVRAQRSSMKPTSHPHAPRKHAVHPEAGTDCCYPRRAHAQIREQTCMGMAAWMGRWDDGGICVTEAGIRAGGTDRETW